MKFKSKINKIFDTSVKSIAYIVFFIITFFSLGISKELGKDLARFASKDGMTREDRKIKNIQSKYIDDTNTPYKLNNDISPILIEGTKEFTQAKVERMAEEYEKLMSSEEISNTIKEVQNLLQDRGYDIGKPDGVLGEKTKIALMRFQLDEKLNITGEIDIPTLEVMDILK